MVSWVTEEVILLDAATPCDSSSHFWSGRAFLRPWLPSLVCFWRVARVGLDNLSVRDRNGVRERFLTRRVRIEPHLFWKFSCLETRHPGCI